MPRRFAERKIRNEIGEGSFRRQHRVELREPILCGVKVVEHIDVSRQNLVNNDIAVATGTLFQSDVSVARSVWNPTAFAEFRSQRTRLPFEKVYKVLRMGVAIGRRSIAKFRRGED